MLGLIRRVHTDFGISVLVTSHLLGELERTCDHVVVIDGGKLLRSSSTSDFTQATASLAVEVTDTTDHPDGTKALRTALDRAGLTVQPVGREADGTPGSDDVLLVDVAERGDVRHRSATPSPTSASAWSAWSSAATASRRSSGPTTMRTPRTHRTPRTARRSRRTGRRKRRGNGGAVDAA
ncbi:hypothetical protein SANTM175S_11056 [Streptomyces antimycoticus]